MASSTTLDEGTHAGSPGAPQRRTGAAELVDVAVADLHEQNNDRQTYEGIGELAESIRAAGQVLSPVLARPRPEGGFWLIAGHRRVRAVRLLGWPTVPAFVGDHDDETAKDQMLAENLARVDLNPIDEAEAYRYRIEVLGQEVGHIAKVAGTNEARIRWRLKLLALAPEIVEAVKRGPEGGGIRHSDAESLVGLPENLQRKLFRRVGELSSEEFYRMCTKVHAELAQGALFDDLTIEEYVVAAKEENPALSPRETAVVCDQVLAGYQRLVADGELPEDLARAVARLRRATEFRLRKARLAPTFVAEGGEHGEGGEAG